MVPCTGKSDNPRDCFASLRVTQGDMGSQPHSAPCSMLHTQVKIRIRVKEQESENLNERVGGR